MSDDAFRYTVEEKEVTLDELLDEPDIPEAVKKELIEKRKSQA